jgi:hypothetical protein
MFYNMRQYIIETATRAINNRKQYTLFNRIIVTVENPLPEKVSLQAVLNRLKESIPKHLLSDLETIYVGDFKPLNDRKIDSMYVNGTVLVSNKHESEKALFNTLLHEFAHAIEEQMSQYLYDDGDLSREFLAKRNTLFNMLKDDYDVAKSEFININFSQKFDDFMYKTIGYDNLGIITSNLFVSPYGCTSLREYFANCFEHFFIEGPHEVEKISPAAAKKIKKILSKNNF